MEDTIDNTENPQHDAKLHVVGSDWEELKDWGYEDDDLIEEDETLFGIENNFPPSNMTEKEWDNDRR